MEAERIVYVRANAYSRAAGQMTQWEYQYTKKKYMIILIYSEEF